MPHASAYPVRGDIFPGGTVAFATGRGLFYNKGYESKVVRVGVGLCPLRLGGKGDVRVKATLSVVILTRDERLHIGRCIDSVRGLAKEIFVVDCHSTDGTQALARGLGATVVEHDWPGNQAEQMRWALESLPLTGDWVLRLDADEYLLPELAEEIAARLDTLGAEVTGVCLRRRHVFLGRWVRRGVYPVVLLRLFRRGKAESRQRLMDEKLVLLEGRAVTFRHDFVDHNLNDLSWWTRKHDGYALREAADLILENDGTERKRWYRRLPLFWRAAAYFLYRYVLRLGFLDGREGFLWHFLQGWWYRTLVDAKVMELHNALKLTGGGTTPSRAALRAVLKAKGITLPGEP